MKLPIIYNKKFDNDFYFIAFFNLLYLICPLNFFKLVVRISLGPTYYYRRHTVGLYNNKSPSMTPNYNVFIHVYLYLYSIKLMVFILNIVCEKL